MGKELEQRFPNFKTPWREYFCRIIYYVFVYVHTHSICVTPILV